MKSAIVTGANGFIGSSLVQKLVENQVRVLALDVKFTDREIFKSEFVITLEKNLNELDENSLAEYTGEYDAFYHLAWAGVNGASKGDPIVQNENVKNVLKCAKIAKNLGCEKFLCAGTVAELAVKSLPNLSVVSAGMTYGVAKHTARLMLETYCKIVGLDFVWMQFSNIYGPSNKTGNLISYTLTQLMDGKDATFGPALQPYDFIFVDDLIGAVYKLGAVKTEKNFYLIGSGEPRILKDYLYAIGKAFGREDLIKVGVRADDGIVYKFEMFNASDLKNAIGEYVKKPFEENIKFTIENF